MMSRGVNYGIMFGDSGVLVLSNRIRDGGMSMVLENIDTLCSIVSSSGFSNKYSMSLHLRQVLSRTYELTHYTTLGMKKPVSHNQTCCPSGLRTVL